MAVQIASIERGRLHVDTKAFGQILDKVSAHPVAILTVSGPLQRGKSNIFNRLSRFLNGTKSTNEVSSLATEMAEFCQTVDDQPNTILMWPEPSVVNHNGQTTAVLLMAVHGNHDGTITTMDNATIFTLGCLLSSVLIYNVKNNLSEDMLQFLTMTVLNARAVSRQLDWQPFAKLLFIVNDWQNPGDYIYGFHEDQTSPSIKNIKKEKLDVLTGILPEGCVVRRELLSSFQDVCCCLMPNLDNQMVQVQGADPLLDMPKWIFRDGSSINKKLHGREVTGNEMKSLIHKWEGLMAISRMPTFVTTAEAPGEVTNVVALAVALKFFMVEMTNATNGQVRLPEEKLRKIKSQKTQEALAMFERMAITEPESTLQRFVGILITEFDESFVAILRENAIKGRYPTQPQSAQPMQIPVNMQIIHSTPTESTKCMSRKSRKMLWALAITLKIIVVVLLVIRYINRQAQQTTYYG